MTKIRILQIAALTLVAAAAPLRAGAAQRHAEGLPANIHYYESVSMMSPAAAAQQAGHPTGTMDVSFYTLGRMFDLKLEAHDPYAPGATVHWVDDGGDVAEPASGGMFFRGRVEGDPDSWARITLRGDALAGVLETGGELYFLEPAARFFGGQATSETLAYRLSDVGVDDIPLGCATEHRAPRRHRTRAESRAARQALRDLLHGAATTAAAGTLQRAQIGMVADYQYFSNPAHGAQSATDLAEIVNSVDGIYQSELGVTLEIISTVVFTTANDPFSETTDYSALLTEFSQWKDSNDNNSSQSMWNTDLAHLFTGRDLDSSVIGIAYIGALCSSTYGVGVDQDFNPSLNLLSLLLAHEMGHNFGAPHDNQAGSACASEPGTYIMNPSISSSLQRKFSPCSKTKINPEVASASCLDTVSTAPPTPPVLDPITSPITLGTTVTLTGSGFTAGSQIIGFVGTSSGTQMIGPFVPRSWTSTQLVWDVPAGMSLGQGFAILAVVNTDQNYVGSAYQQALLYGQASLNRPTILGINGGPLHQPDGALPVVYVSTPVYPGAVVTLTGTGFNNAGLNFFTAVGNMGPLWPMAGATSTQIKVQIPANAPIGLGAFEVINNPYAGFVGSQTVFVPIGDPPTISGVSQNGSTITVSGTGFANGAMVNFFNKQPSGAVANVGGPGMHVTVVSMTQLTFAVPDNASPGASYVQVINPPFITLTSTGNDPDGGFTLQ